MSYDVKLLVPTSLAMADQLSKEEQFRIVSMIHYTACVSYQLKTLIIIQ